MLSRERATADCGSALPRPPTENYSLYGKAPPRAREKERERENSLRELTFLAIPLPQSEREEGDEEEEEEAVSGGQGVV